MQGQPAQRRPLRRRLEDLGAQADQQVEESLQGRLITIDDLQALPAVDLGAHAGPDPHGRPVRGHGHLPVDHQRAGPHAQTTLEVRDGERVRLVLENHSSIVHSMHLHGHAFQVRRAGGRRPGPRKDTVIVRPMARLAVEFDATNPGRWMIHCRNVYHQEAGMMATLAYTG